MDKGTLVRWLEEKGYGFIKPESGGSDVFLHITDLKGISRKPVVGDVIFYRLSLDDNGKHRATDAKIEGVEHVFTLTPMEKKEQPKTYPAASSQRTPSMATNHRESNIPVTKALLFIVIIMSLFAYFHNKGSIPSGDMFTENIIDTPATIKLQFHCEGKTRCSEMGSYEEAEFYLHNCPDTKMDGDGDGIPCERQF